MYYIKPPDLKGRRQIWNIHTKSLVENGILEPAILDKLAMATEGFTGAMIKGCVSDSVLRKRS